MLKSRIVIIKGLPTLAEPIDNLDTRKELAKEAGWKPPTTEKVFPAHAGKRGFKGSLKPPLINTTQAQGREDLMEI
jgi:hypothetical protein